MSIKKLIQLSLLVLIGLQLIIYQSCTPKTNCYFFSQEKFSGGLYEADENGILFLRWYESNSKNDNIFELENTYKLNEKTSIQIQHITKLCAEGNEITIYFDPLGMVHLIPMLTRNKGNELFLVLNDGILISAPVKRNTLNNITFELRNNDMDSITKYLTEVL